MKPIVKEIAIMLLIFIIVVLGFGIILYDYIPTKEVEISELKYEPSNQVKEALKEIATSETTNVILTYEVTDSDLSIYESTKSYDKGKANPFSTYSTINTTTESGGVTTNNNNSGTAGNNSTASSTNSEQSTTNTFYEKNDTK